jgi:hypothetical protein
MSDAIEGAAASDDGAGAGDSDYGPVSDRFRPGDLVVDVEDADTDADEAVVVNVPPVAARDWDAYTTDDGDTVSVAEDNPGYSPDAPVVVVAFADELGDARPEYDGNGPLALAPLTDDVMVYGFPEARLDRVGEYDGPAGVTDDDGGGDTGGDSDTGGDDGTGTVGNDSGEGDGPDGASADPHDDILDDLRALADHLAAGADVAVRDPRGADTTPWVRVDKLGDTYRVHGDGTVDGDGPLVDRLTDLAGDYLGGGEA